MTFEHILLICNALLTLVMIYFWRKSGKSNEPVNFTDNYFTYRKKKMTEYNVWVN